MLKKKLKSLNKNLESIFKSTIKEAEKKVKIEKIMKETGASFKSKLGSFSTNLQQLIKEIGDLITNNKDSNEAKIKTTMGEVEKKFNTLFDELHKMKSVGIKKEFDGKPNKKKSNDPLMQNFFEEVQKKSEFSFSKLISQKNTLELSDNFKDKIKAYQMERKKCLVFLVRAAGKFYCIGCSKNYNEFIKNSNLYLNETFCTKLLDKCFTYLETNQETKALRNEKNLMEKIKKIKELKDIFAKLDKILVKARNFVRKKKKFFNIIKLNFKF